MSLRHLRSDIYRQLNPSLGPAGRLSSINRAIVIAIILAVAFAIAETEDDLIKEWPAVFDAANRVFGSLFLFEYSVRLWTAAEADPSRPWSARLRFVCSLAGVIDLLAVSSSLLPAIGFNSTPLRIMRIVRIVRLARLGRVSMAIRHIVDAVSSRRDELLITLAIAGIVLLVGSTALYWIEGSAQPDKFGSIPRAMWWAVVTLTTIGYGDVYPITPLGKLVASLVALAGVGVIALPAGILAAAFSDGVQRHRRSDKESGR